MSKMDVVSNSIKAANRIYGNIYNNLDGQEEKLKDINYTSAEVYAKELEKAEMLGDSNAVANIIAKMQRDAVNIRAAIGKADFKELDSKQKSAEFLQKFIALSKEGQHNLDLSTKGWEAAVKATGGLNQKLKDFNSVINNAVKLIENNKEVKKLGRLYDIAEAGQDYAVAMGHGAENTAHEMELFNKKLEVEQNVFNSTQKIMDDIAGGGFESSMLGIAEVLQQSFGSIDKTGIEGEELTATKKSKDEYLASIKEKYEAEKNFGKKSKEYENAFDNSSKKQMNFAKTMQALQKKANDAGKKNIAAQIAALINASNQFESAGGNIDVVMDNMKKKGAELNSTSVEGYKKAIQKLEIIGNSFETRLGQQMQGLGKATIDLGGMDMDFDTIRGGLQTALVGVEKEMSKTMEQRAKSVEKAEKKRAEEVEKINKRKISDEEKSSLIAKEDAILTATKRKAAEDMAKFSKQASDEIQSARSRMLDIVALDERKLDIESDLMGQIGAPFETIIALEQKGVGIAREKLEKENEILAVAEQKFKEGKIKEEQLITQRLNARKAEAEVIKKQMGAQRNMMDKLLSGFASGFQKVAGFGGPTKAAKFGAGYTGVGGAEGFRVAGSPGEGGMGLQDRQNKANLSGIGSPTGLGRTPKRFGVAGDIEAFGDKGKPGKVVKKTETKTVEGKLDALNKTAQDIADKVSGIAEDTPTKKDNPARNIQKEVEKLVKTMIKQDLKSKDPEKRKRAEEAKKEYKFGNLKKAKDIVEGKKGFADEEKPKVNLGKKLETLSKTLKEKESALKDQENTVKRLDKEYNTRKKKLDDEIMSKEEFEKGKATDKNSYKYRGTYDEYKEKQKKRNIDRLSGVDSVKVDEADKLYKMNQEVMELGYQKQELTKKKGAEDKVKAEKRAKKEKEDMDWEYNVKKREEYSSLSNTDLTKRATNLENIKGNIEQQDKAYGGKMERTKGSSYKNVSKELDFIKREIENRAGTGNLKKMEASLENEIGDMQNGGAIMGDEKFSNKYIAKGKKLGKVRDEIKKREAVFASGKTRKEWEDERTVDLSEGRYKRQRMAEAEGQTRKEGREVGFQRQEVNYRGSSVDERGNRTNTDGGSEVFLSSVGVDPKKYAKLLKEAPERRKKYKEQAKSFMQSGSFGGKADLRKGMAGFGAKMDIRSGAGLTSSKTVKKEKAASPKELKEQSEKRLKRIAGQMSDMERVKAGKTGGGDLAGKPGKGKTELKIKIEFDNPMFEDKIMRVVLDNDSKIVASGMATS